MTAEEKQVTSQPSNRWIRHAFSVCKKCSRYVAYLAGAAVVFLIIASAVLHFFVLPYIAAHPSKIEQIATNAVGVPVTIGRVETDWQGISPQIRLFDVSVNTTSMTPLLLPEIRTTLSWNSVLAWQLQLRNLTLIQPNLLIERHADDHITINGIALSSGDANGDGLSWLLNQGHIRIEGATLHWQDAVRQAALMLTDVGVDIRNGWGQHKATFMVKPILPNASPMQMEVRFHRPVSSFFDKKNEMDMTQWAGTVYLDVEQTDLAVWKRYIDYPIQISSGVGAIQARLDINRTKIERLSAKVNLSDVDMQLDSTLTPLQLKKVQGDITAKETSSGFFKQGFTSIGASGHSITLKNFYLQTVSDDVLQSDLITESYFPATDNQLENITVQASQLNLKTLMLLSDSLPLSTSQRGLLKDLQPSGELRDFSVALTGSYPEIHRYHLKGYFDHLSITPQAFRAGRPKTNKTTALPARMATPGVQNATGFIDTTEQKGKLTLDARDVTLQFPDYLPVSDIPLNRLEVNADWQMQQEDTHALVKLHHLYFQQNAMEGSVSGTQNISILSPESSWVDMQAKVANVDVAALGGYWPNALDKDVREWLTGALVKGHIDTVESTLRGKLSDFPFTSEASLRSETKFTVKGVFHDASMNYYPGHFLVNSDLPEWPLLENAKGSFLIDRTKLSVQAESATTQGVDVSNVRAEIGDISSSQTELHIDGRADGALTKMLTYVKNSPVNGWLEGFTEDAQATGNGQVRLQFQMPIADPEATKVQGSVTFLKNTVQLFNALPKVNTVEGSIAFNEKGFTLNKLRGQMLGYPLTATGGTTSDGEMHVSIQGKVGLDQAKKEWDTPLKPVIDQMDGMGSFLATADTVHGNTTIKVVSSLEGVESRLPEPLNKKAQARLPFSVTLEDASSSNPLWSRDKIAVTLGNIVAAEYQRQKPKNSKRWQVVRGGVGIYHAAPIPDKGVVVHVAMPAIDMDKWIASRSAFEKDLSAADADSQQYMADTIIADTNALTISQRTLHHVALSASRTDGMWKSRIQSDEIVGTIMWREPARYGDYGHVVAQLSKLHIPESESEYIEEASQTGKYAHADIPALDVHADDFQLYGKPLGKLSLSAATENTQTGQEWHIHQLMLDNPDGKLTAKGTWLLARENAQSQLHYELDVHNGGNLLERLGFKDLLKGGEGKLQGEVQWNGSLFSLDIPTLRGTIDLDMAKGQFLQIEPGAARLFGVLSLQSLPRRLTLDFKDVFSAGLAFDRTHGKASITDGILAANDFNIHSVNVDIHLQGQVDLEKETQHLLVNVVPDVSLGAASIAMLAVNPIIGIGTYVTQLAFGNSLKRSLSYTYDISGDWRDPVIVKKDTVKEEKSETSSSVKAPEKK